jgi:hypothetical protein
MDLNVPSVNLEIELCVQRHRGRADKSRQKNRFCPEVHPILLCPYWGGAASLGGAPSNLIGGGGKEQ